MKKSNNLNKTYISLSKHESALLNAVEPFVLFSLAQVQKVTKWKLSTISNILFLLKKKGILASVRKDTYVLARKIPGNMFAIATLANSPSYISFWTACSYYGLTSQQVRTIQVVSTNQYPLLQFQQSSIETTTFQPARFYGYQRIGNFAIAEVEKLIVDCLYKPDKIGGINELGNCLQQAWPKVNQPKLQQYLVRFNNRALYARLGYLLEELKLPNKLVAFCLGRLPSGYTYLNPARKPTFRYNRRWRIHRNDK